MTSVESLVSKVRSGIIRIETTTCDGGGTGTGFLVGSRLIATVEHVVDGAAKISLKQNGHVLGSAVVVGEDPARDLALLETSKPIHGYYFALAERAPRLAEQVVALGFPLGLPLTVTQGSVSGLGRAIPIANVTRRQLVQTDAALNPGNSGGPLLATDTGAVIGLVDLGTSQANGISFAVSAGVAGPLLKAWQVAPQPVPMATCAGLPVAAGSTAAPASAGGSDLVGYVEEVSRLLENSASVRQQLVAAVAKAGSNRAAAAQAIASVVAARRDELALVEAMAIPAGANDVQTALSSAFALSLRSDLLYQQWVLSDSQRLLAEAQANDSTTVVAKAAFLRLYNSLRQSAGLPLIPSDFPF